MRTPRVGRTRRDCAHGGGGGIGGRDARAFSKTRTQGPPGCTMQIDRQHTTSTGPGRCRRSIAVVAAHSLPGCPVSQTVCHLPCPARGEEQFGKQVIVLTTSLPPSTVTVKSPSLVVILGAARTAATRRSNLAAMRQVQMPLVILTLSRTNVVDIDRHSDSSDSQNFEPRKCILCYMRARAVPAPAKTGGYTVVLILQTPNETEHKARERVHRSTVQRLLSRRLRISYEHFCGA